jgi:hypothetical protein
LSSGLRLIAARLRCRATHASLHARSVPIKTRARS